jgi:hypothetical protein
MQRLLIFLMIIQSALLLVSCSKIKSLSTSPAHDGFDGSTLSDIWETDKIVSSDAELQSKIVRSGYGAIKITIHSGDKFELGQHGSLPTERAELTEAEQLISYEGKTYSYKFSIYFPTDFPIVPTRLVIAQWKQECPRGGICDDNSPVLALRYISGVLRITQNIGGHQKTFYRSQKELRGRWLDFKFHICFSKNNNGRIIAYLNDSLIVDQTGSTAYQEDRSTGYPDPSRFYFKMGLYRDAIPELMTIFIDEYTKELLADN